MSRLVRGLWQVEALLVGIDKYGIDHQEVSRWEYIDAPDTFEQAEHRALSCGEGIATIMPKSTWGEEDKHRLVSYRAIRARMKQVPGTRAPWEYLAPYEASDKPVWNEYWE